MKVFAAFSLLLALPLLAAPANHRWSVVLSTEDPRYGGSGTAPPDTEQEGWYVAGRSALVVRPLTADRARVETRARVQGSAQEAKLKPKSD